MALLKRTKQPDNPKKSLLKQQEEKEVVFTEKGLSEEAALMERESFHPLTRSGALF